MLAARTKHYQAEAKRRGLDWHLAGADVDRLVRGDCHYCGSPPANRLEKRGVVLWYNGIDRTDNGRGYTIDNVVSCCGVCNHAKHVMGYREFLSWVGKVWSYQTA